jgi:AcrR family transcriptional regulator
MANDVPANSRPCTGSGTSGAPPYHHGDLKSALLVAAEQILRDHGPAGLTLRAAARGAGVSHAAPTHHFRDLSGLLSELAAVGFRRFADHLAQAALSAGPDPGDRMAALGKAYVSFARADPNLFLLMFRGERLDRGRPALRDAANEAFAVLRHSAAAQAPPAADPMVEAIRAWSLVHGFALLLIDGQLPPDRSPDDLLDAMLSHRLP